MWLDEKPDARAVVNISLIAEGRVRADPLEIEPEFLLYSMPAMGDPNYRNVSSQVDSRFLQYQMKIEKAFVSKEGELPMAKMERVGGDEKHLGDVILLNQYIRNNGLSRAKSDALLKMCAKICSNHGWKWPMYKSAKALHTVCEKHMMKFHSRKKQSWRIPKVFIGDMGVLEDRTRSKTRGAARNIMQKVAYELVFQSPDNFAAKLPNPKLRDGQQIISDWSTSNLFANGTRVVQKLFGEDAVFMGLAISIDGTMSNSRAVEICPVSVSILNLIGDGSEMLFHVAYFPLVVHQSNTELRQLLEAKGIGTVKAKDELIKIITKKLGFDFMYNILKEGSGWMFSEGTVNLEDARPYRMQVGSKDGVGGMKIFNMCPFFCGFIIDGKQGDLHAGCNSSHCRICTTEKMYSLKRDGLGEFRVKDSLSVECVRKDGEQILVQHASGCRILPSLEVSHGKFSSQHGISAGRNPVTELSMISERLGLLSFHLMDPPDILHVVSMGLFLKVLGKAANLIRIFDDKIFTGRKQQGTKLHDFDSILKKWQHAQCFEPVRFFKMDGLTRHMTAESKENKNLGHATSKFNCKCYQKIILPLKLSNVMFYLWETYF